MKFENLSDVFMMEVTLPPNTYSEICLPKKFENYDLFCNGKQITGEKEKNSVVIKDVLPGFYKFELKNR